MPKFGDNRRVRLDWLGEPDAFLEEHDDGTALLALIACGSDDSGSEPAPMDAQCFGCSDATVDEMDGGGGGQGGGATAEHLRLSYIKESRPKAAGVQPVVDLVVYDFEDDEEINLTNGEGVVDCITRSCQLNAGMTWVGWIEGGGRLKVAPVALGEKRIKTDEVREVADNVQQFSFTTFVPNPDEPTAGAIPQIVYSRGNRWAVMAPSMYMSNLWRGLTKMRVSSRHLNARVSSGRSRRMVGFE